MLQHRLEVRAEARIEGDFLFPSTRAGKQWHKKSHYKCAKKVLEDAGIDNSEGDFSRLRHTFVLRQLRRGFEPDTVAA